MDRMGRDPMGRDPSGRDGISRDGTGRDQIISGRDGTGLSFDH